MSEMGIGVGIECVNNVLKKIFIILLDMPFVLHECKLAPYIVTNKSC